VNVVPKPMPAASYERAKRLANIALWSVELQCRRLRSAEPEDGAFALRKWADFHFLVVSLTRLRRAAQLAARVPELHRHLADAIARFDSALPGLKAMRDVSEHIDEYALDQGQRRNVSRQELEVSSLAEEGPTLNWLGSTLNASDALRSSQELFVAISEGSRLLRDRVAQASDPNGTP
jgi:hypothetical protein